MQIIQRRQRVEIVSYELVFIFVNERGRSFGFPCDKSGNVNESELTACGLDSLTQCRAGAIDGNAVRKPTINRSVKSYTEPAIGRCDCGCDVTLAGFTNTCEGCGADYNSAGQQLAPRSQWGEETGESLADILAIC